MRSRRQRRRRRKKTQRWERSKVFSVAVPKRNRRYLRLVHIKIVISGPVGFKHESSMKFNASTGEIDLENLPPEMLEIFKKAGVTKKDLQDKTTAIEIFKAVAMFNDNVFVFVHR